MQIKKYLKKIKLVYAAVCLNEIVGGKGATSYLKFFLLNSLPSWLVRKIYKSPNGIISYFPVHKQSQIWGNVFVGKNTRLSRWGCYIQGGGKLFFGDYVTVAPSCAILSSNHDVYNHDRQVRKETVIGDHCWLGFGCRVMAGVILGPRTIVAAGSVVTHSFPDGFCIIGGTPAKVIKLLNKEEFVPRCRDYELYGYIPGWKFDSFFAKNFGNLKFDYDLTTVSNCKYAKRLLKDSL